MMKKIFDLKVPDDPVRKIESDIQEMILSQKAHYEARQNKIHHREDAKAIWDATPWWIELILCLILIPIILPVLIYASLKWLRLVSFKYLSR